MKRKLFLSRITLGSLFFCFSLLTAPTAKAQRNNSKILHYYFGAQQVAIKESNSKLYLRIPQTDMNAVKQQLQRQFQLNNEAISETESLNFLVIEIEENRIEEITTYIKASMPLVEMVRPVLIANDGVEEVIDEWFYVKLKNGVTKNELDAVLTKHHCSIDRPYEYNDKVYIIKATEVNGFDGLKMANLFYEEGIFEYAEPDFRPLQLLHTPPPPPNDPNYYLQWTHINDGTSAQFSGTLGADMDVDSAWTITQGSPTIRVAVIDEGVQRNHPDLINNIDPLGFGVHTSVATTGDVLSNSRSHGTNVSGIIAAQANNNIGVAGIAPNCKIIPINLTVNTTGSFGTFTQIATCMDWAWSTGGADVINNSWGGGAPSSLLKNAIQNAVTLGRSGKGAVVLFSSGNNNSSVSSPAIFDEVISIGATSMCHQRKSTTSCDGENWWGGNYGSTLDVSAPGVKIATTTTNSGYNNTFNGTSAACPNAAGVVALMLSANDTLSEKRVREILLRTAKKVGGYNYYNAQGQAYGTWSSELGHGVINAYKAVQAADNDVKYCPVQIDTPNAIQVCNGNTVALQVLSPDPSASYTWMQNGSVIPAATGAAYNAAATGSYSVTISKAGCNDTSASLKITVSSPNGILQAHAGKDTTLVASSKMILGGGPAASGGTAIQHPMRGIVTNIYTNDLLRFDMEQPATNYKVVKNNFVPGFNSSSTFFSGAAATPYGIYMAIRTDDYLAKIDTATGAVINIGSFGASLDFGGMTYDPKTGKIFAVRESNNSLYEINRVTGQATFIASSSVTSPMFVSLSADTAGVLYAVAISATTPVGSRVYTINKTTGVATLVGATGYGGYYAQDGAVDLLTNELYTCPYASALNNNSYVGAGLWKLNKSNGTGTIIGAISQPYNQMDAMAFSGGEYKYSWSPTTGLSNPNDGNPQFTPPSAGIYTFVLTATDLCGNTAQDTVKITVCPTSFTPTSLSASNITDSSATLGWNSIADSATVEYGLQGFTQGNGTLVRNITQNSHYIKGLTANTSYSFYVRSFCNNGSSSWAGPFTFTTQNNPLPLTGITLKGSIKEKTAFLQWVSLQEKDAAYYIVEKSDDGKNFILLYSIDAKANDKTNVTYEWKDEDLKNGTNFYRIAGVSYDGDKTYSNTLKIQYGATVVSGITIYPNPVKGSELSIQFLNLAEGNYEVKLYTVTGLLVGKHTINHKGNNVVHKTTLISEVATGVYNIQITNTASDISFRQQIVIE